MHNESSSRLVAILFALFFGALALSGASGYVSPVQAQRPDRQQPIIIMATPRLPTAMPTEAPQPTAILVPAETPPQPTPEPVVVIQYVPVPVPVVEEAPPTVALPPPGPAGETIIQIDPIKSEGPEFGSKPNRRAPPNKRTPDMPEAVHP